MKCVIIGAGGHGRVVLDILLCSGGHEVVGFIDSAPALHGRRTDGLPVLGGPEALPDLQHDGVEGAVIAIGDNGVRTDFARRVEGLGFELVNAVHPSANLARTVTLGRNVVVAAGVLVCAHCQIGDSVILNTGCIIDHECKIGTAAHVCPGVRLAGHVTVDTGAHVGIGATVIQDLHIRTEAVVGAGAVVIHDVPPRTTVVGVPARPVEPRPTVQPHTERVTVPSRYPPHRQPVPAGSG